MNVRVDQDPDTGLWVPQVEEGPLKDKRYSRFAGAIGWPDPKGTDVDGAARHWLFVCAQRDTGELVAFEEHSGHLVDIGKAAIAAKDRLCLDTIWIDGVQEKSVMTLRQMDGLTFYKEHQSIVDGRWHYTHGPEYWPAFRSYDCLTTLVEVSDDVRVSLEYGLQLLIDLLKRDRFQYMASCLGVQKILQKRPPLDDILTHPLLRAVVWTVIMMHGYEPTDADQSDDYYDTHPNPIFG